ncbi:anthrone oxygenase family protein [Streptomyces sp. NPDC006976]|uniref:anthrone oxygenase family protein n=1 Tax=Streptomyces sp. NPDC006976 TaxID=3154311 RepID=UPI0033EE9072
MTTTTRPDRPTPASHRLVLGAAAVTTGLMAGTFYAFSCAVMPALGRSDDRTFIAVMRDINDVIENPVFFAGFFGALLLTAVAAWQHRRSPGPRGWIFAALVVYAVAFLLTSGVNVPLNNALADAGDPARLADPAAVRDRFEDAWNAWNTVRALLCTAALALLLRAPYAGARRSGPAQEPAYLASAAGSRASR